MTNILYRFIYASNAVPLPIGMCIVVFFLNLFNGMASTNLSSYLPQLVKTFNVTEVNAGKYAGIVSSSLSVSRIVSSVMWGYICDKFGRKMSLICTGSGLAFATLLFGFTISFTWTVVTRSFQGLFMGLIVITKSIIADIADQTNLATGLSFIFSANNIGYIIGPSMAGFLVFPTEKYPKIFEKGGFFDVFKVLLPNLIISCGLIFVLLVSLLILPRKTKMLNLMDEKTSNIRKLSCENKITMTCSNLYMYESATNNDEGENNKSTLALFDLVPEKVSSKIDLKHDIDSKNPVVVGHQSRYRKLLGNKHFILSTTLYGIFSMTTVGYEDMFPLFASTITKYNGLGMSTSEIGLLYLVTGFTVTIIQFLIITKIIAKFGPKKIFSVTTLLFSILVFLLPTMTRIKNKTGLWITLWITQCFMRSMYNAGILCVNIFINNSVDSEQLGLANGVGLSVASFGRSAGSLGFGLAYSWSLSNIKKHLISKTGHGFPFNEYFTFILISFSSIIVTIIARLLPETINKKKTEQKTKKEIT